MPLRKMILLGCVAMLGGAIGVMPALAGSETPPTIEAVNTSGVYPHAWSPSVATIGVNGVVTFANPSSQTPHGIHWTGGPNTPNCTSGVPVNSSGTGWSGQCTFTQNGTYTFQCYVHAYMTGTITVGSGGTTTTTTTTPTGTTTTTTVPTTTTPTTTTPANSPTTSTPTSTTTQPYTYANPGSGPEAGHTPSPASGRNGGAGYPLAGAASSAVKLHTVKGGSAVGGSVNLSAAGAGGRLTVSLLATTASLASASSAQRVSVGRFQRSHLHAGIVTFTIALNAAARRALRAHKHLALSAEIELTPLHGPPLKLLRKVVVRS